MVEYTGIPTDLLDEIIEQRREHDELLDRLTRSWTMKFKFADGPQDLLTLGQPSGPPLRERRAGGARESEGSRATGRIRIGNRKGEMTYADALAELVSDAEFSFEEAARVVLPRIVTRSARPRDSLRAAIDRDRRFERVEGQGDLRYRRVARGRSHQRARGR